jgi:hypothetical protein
MTRYAVLLVGIVLVGAYVVGTVAAGMVQGWVTATGIGG